MDSSSPPSPRSHGTLQPTRAAHALLTSSQINRLYACACKDDSKFFEDGPMRAPMTYISVSSTGTDSYGDFPGLKYLGALLEGGGSNMDLATGVLLVSSHRGGRIIRQAGCPCICIAAW
ncbi:hypothetical protein TWF696_000060 [Orbilia brochopaga]|uniref:Uncharacterized protein n=1 Tax=Orbilia brochopaga TaxID=3140254 RepID=A0AAV9VAA5_9PEZI